MVLNGSSVALVYLAPHPLTFVNCAACKCILECSLGVIWGFRRKMSFDSIRCFMQSAVPSSDRPSSLAILECALFINARRSCSLLALTRNVRSTLKTAKVRAKLGKDYCVRSTLLTSSINPLTWIFYVRWICPYPHSMQRHFIFQCHRRAETQ